MPQYSNSVFRNSSVSNQTTKPVLLMTLRKTSGIWDTLRIIRRLVMRCQMVFNRFSISKKQLRLPGIYFKLWIFGKIEKTSITSYCFFVFIFILASSLSNASCPVLERVWKWDVSIKRTISGTVTEPSERVLSGMRLSHGHLGRMIMGQYGRSHFLHLEKPYHFLNLGFFDFETFRF